MHLTPWLVFFLIYFGIYFFIAWKQETLNVFAFFIGYLFLRVPIAATFAILYWLAQEEPKVSMVPEAETPVVVSTDPPLNMEAVELLPSE